MALTAKKRRERIALAATELVDKEVAKLDPLLITGIFKTALDMFAECRKRKNLAPEAAHAAITDSYQGDRELSKKQTRHLINRAAREGHNTRLKPFQTRELAAKLMAQGMKLQPAEVAAACA